MSYPHRHTVALSIPQGKKLVRGHKIRISVHALMGRQPPSARTRHHPAELHLTTGQAKKVGSAIRMSRGTELHMTAKQVRHHARHGRGFFSDLAKKAAKTVAGPLLNAGLNKLTQIATKINPTLGAVVGGLGQKGLDLAGSHFGFDTAPTGAGIRRRRTVHRRVGAGFLDDIGFGVRKRRATKKRRGAGFLDDIGFGVRKRRVGRRRGAVRRRVGSSFLPA